MATRTDRVEADFVVVGAGSAGCAVAARLSEDTATRVVLLEAGGEDKNRWIHIPLGFGKTFADPSVNWCYQTEPDPGAADRRVFWPRGKVMGGLSATTISTARARTASATTRRRRATAGAARPPLVICVRRCSGPICESSPKH